MGIMPNGSDSENQTTILRSAGTLFGVFRMPAVLLGGSMIFLVLSLFLLYSSSRPQTPISYSIASDTTPDAGAPVRTVVIDIAGGVVHPGVYTLPKGSRIDDAITAAGGFSENADRSAVEKSVNRAAELVDSAKISIPVVGTSEPGNNTPGQNNPVVAIPAQGGRIPINTASQALLEELDGVGPATAKKIIAGRPFTTLDELVARKIISASVFEKIKEEITL